MATQFPGALDDLHLVTLTPDEVPLSQADKAGGPAPRKHDEHHRDLGAATRALQSMSISYDHDHSGDTSSTNKPGMHKGSKLKQANTHQSPDTDSSASALHHTLGNGAYQAAPGKATKDALTSLESKTTSITANVTKLNAYKSFKVFTTLADLNNWQASASTSELASDKAVLAYVENEETFYVVKAKSNKQELDPGTPAGVISMYGGLTPPKGHLLCDGASYSRTEYPDLFKAIGTRFGSDSNSTFKVPDMRGRFPVGLKASDVDFESMNKKAGAKSHAHTEGNLSAAIGAIMNNTLTIGYQAGKINARSPKNVTSYSLWFSGHNVARANSYRRNHDTPVYGTTSSNKVLPPYATLNFVIKF